eukprot:3679112-Amphidinium_carterae.1
MLTCHATSTALRFSLKETTQHPMMLQIGSLIVKGLRNFYVNASAWPCKLRLCAVGLFHGDLLLQTCHNVMCCIWVLWSAHAKCVVVIVPHMTMSWCFEDIMVSNDAYTPAQSSRAPKPVYRERLHMISRCACSPVGAGENS